MKHRQQRSRNGSVLICRLSLRERACFRGAKAGKGVKQGHYSRHGATAVEFALVVPIIFLLFYGAFEYSRMSMVLHTVEMAAYEGARRAVVPGATADDAMNAAKDTLAAVGVQKATVSVSPNPIMLQTSQVT